MRISGQCSRSSTTGVITGKVSSQTDIIKCTSGCVFLSGGKQGAPVQKNGNQNQYDSTTGTFTFTRTTTTRANDMGQAKMNFCFTKPHSSLFTGFNSFQKQHLSYTKQIDQYCDNAIHKASVETEGTYKMENNIPTDVVLDVQRLVLHNGMVDQEDWFTRIQHGLYKNCPTLYHQLPTLSL